MTDQEKIRRRSSVRELPEEEQPEESSYKVPEKVGLDDLMGKDADDESLRKYKEQLLAQAAAAPEGIDPNDTRQVIIQQLRVCVPGREDVVMDVTKPQEKPYTLKEGCNFQIKVNFAVQKDIVSGLKYVNLVYKHKVRVDKDETMMGSYGPGNHEYSFPMDTAPRGMMARGHYTAKTRFVDDDANIHLEYEFAFDIKKEWAE